jgi:hypothetical protein
MIELLVEYDMIDQENVNVAAQNKRDKLKVYSNIFDKEEA